MHSGVFGWGVGGVREARRDWSRIRGVSGEEELRKSSIDNQSANPPKFLC